MENLKNIKIAFIDIDGTLANDNNEIAEYTKNAIRNAVSKGIYMIICSGRTNHYTVERSKMASASNIVISDNGALIYDYNNDNKIWESSISKEKIEKIIDFVEKNEIICSLNSTYERYRTKNSHNEYTKGAVVINDVDDIKGNITQIVFDSDDYLKLCKAKEFIETFDDLEINNISPNLINKIKDSKKYWFDTANKGNGKGNAIKRLLEFLDLEKKNAICFGDHINDFSMFESVGTKVAMGNGMQDLKEKADYITLTNNENGVAHFIEKYML